MKKKNQIKKYLNVLVYETKNEKLLLIKSTHTPFEQGNQRVIYEDSVSTQYVRLGSKGLKEILSEYSDKKVSNKQNLMLYHISIKGELLERIERANGMSVTSLEDKKLYLIKSKCKKYFKVGIAKDVISRVVGFHGMEFYDGLNNSYKIDYDNIYGVSIQDAFKAEQILHYMLKDERADKDVEFSNIKKKQESNGDSEWFKYNDSIFLKVKTIVEDFTGEKFEKINIDNLIKKQKSKIAKIEKSLKTESEKKDSSRVDESKIKMFQDSLNKERASIISNDK